MLPGDMAEGFTKCFATHWRRKLSSALVGSAAEDWRIKLSRMRAVKLAASLLILPGSIAFIRKEYEILMRAWKGRPTGLSCATELMP